MKAFLCTVLLTLTFSMVVYASLPDDIVLYFSFSEGSGNKVKDFSKYGNNGEITGTPQWVKGQNDGALDLDGKTTVILVPLSDSLGKLKAPMTVGAILNVVEYPIDWQGVASMDSTAASRDNGWKCGFHTKNPTLTRWPDTDFDATNITLKEGEWHYLVYVFDAQDAKFYVDGELAQDMPAPTLNNINVSQSPHLDIGAESGTPGNYYSHLILDELWISNIAASADEIKSLSNPASILSVNSRDKTATVWGKLKSK
jgi:hypothetical protein